MRLFAQILLRIIQLYLLSDWIIICQRFMIASGARFSVIAYFEKKDGKISLGTIYFEADILTPASGRGARA